MRQATSVARPERPEGKSEAAAGPQDGLDGGARRLFADEAGILWTAELRRPRLVGPDGRPASPLILFWSDTRACLATLRRAQPISELSEEDLRGHLRACLAG